MNGGSDQLNKRMHADGSTAGEDFGSSVSAAVHQG